MLTRILPLISLMSGGPGAYPPGNNEKGRTETAMECTRYLVRTASSDDESDASRIRLHASRQTVAHGYMTPDTSPRRRTRVLPQGR